MQHLRDEAGLGSRDPPTFRSTPGRVQAAPSWGVRTVPPRDREEASGAGRRKGAGGEGGGREAGASGGWGGQGGREAGTERGLTWRDGRSGARAAAASAAALRPRATAPPDTAPQRSGRGDGGRRPGSSAPGPAAPAPPRALTAAGSASALAASPSWGRAGAASEAHWAPPRRAGPWPS